MIAVARGLLAGLLIALLTGCGQPEGAERLTVYSAGPRPLIEAACQSFTEATGIPVDLFQATTGQLMAKLEAEKYRPRADVVLFASEAAAAAMKRDHRLIAFHPEAANLLHEDWSDPDGYYWASGAALVGVAVRTEHGVQWPETWAEWLAMEDARRMVMPSPSRSGAAGDFLVAYALQNPDTVIDDFRGLRARGLEFAAANSQAIGGLLMGAYDVMLGAVDYLIYRQIAQGEPLAMRYPADGAVLVTRPIAVLASSPRLEEAQAFVDHYLTEDIQQRVAAAYLLPARIDVPTSDVRSPAAALIRADPDEAVQKQSTLLRRFQYRVERAVVVEPTRGRQP